MEPELTQEERTRQQLNLPEGYSIGGLASDEPKTLSNSPVLQYMFEVGILRRSAKEKNLLEWGIPEDIAMDFYGFLTSETVKSNLSQKDYEVTMCRLRGVKMRIVGKYADMCERGVITFDKYDTIIDQVNNVVEAISKRTLRSVSGFAVREMHTGTTEHVLSNATPLGEVKSRGFLGGLRDKLTRR